MVAVDAHVRFKVAMQTAHRVEARADAIVHAAVAVMRGADKMQKMAPLAMLEAAMLDEKVGNRDFEDVRDVDRLCSRLGLRVLMHRPLLLFRLGRRAVL